MSDDRYDFVWCICEEDWKSRGRYDPRCRHDAMLDLWEERFAWRLYSIEVLGQRHEAQVEVDKLGREIERLRVALEALE